MKKFNKITDILDSDTLQALAVLALPTLTQMAAYQSFEQVTIAQRLILLLIALTATARIFISKVGQMTWVRPLVGYLTIAITMGEMLVTSVQAMSPTATLFQVAMAFLITQLKYKTASVQPAGTSGERIQVSADQKETWLYKHRLVIGICALIAVGIIYIEVGTKDKPYKATGPVLIEGIWCQYPDSLRNDSIK